MPFVTEMMIKQFVSNSDIFIEGEIPFHFMQGRTTCTVTTPHTIYMLLLFFEHIINYKKGVVIFDWVTDQTL